MDDKLICRLAVFRRRESERYLSRAEVHEIIRRVWLETPNKPDDTPCDAPEHDPYIQLEWLLFENLRIAAGGGKSSGGKVGRLSPSSRREAWERAQQVQNCLSALIASKKAPAAAAAAAEEEATLTGMGTSSNVSGSSQTGAAIPVAGKNAVMAASNALARRKGGTALDTGKDLTAANSANQTRGQRMATAKAVIAKASLAAATEEVLMTEEELTGTGVSSSKSPVSSKISKIPASIAVGANSSTKHSSSMCREK
jgi:hypothetical protein